MKVPEGKVMIGRCVRCRHEDYAVDGALCSKCDGEVEEKPWDDAAKKDCCNTISEAHGWEGQELPLKEHVELLQRKLGEDIQGMRMERELTSYCWPEGYNG